MRKLRIGQFALAVVAMFAFTALVAASAGANEVAYNNLNTVPATVNGHPDEDTYSQDYEGFMGGKAFGGQIETVNTNSRLVRRLTTQLDVFACETGEYQLENCVTRHASRKFTQKWTASIYEVGAGNEPGALVATGETTAKLHYRPSTNTSCPATSGPAEGKGFGVNCDVGGYLQTIVFKHFTQSRPMPAKAIVLLTNGCEACGGKVVNVGLQTAYKEFTGGQYFSEPPANSGVPAVGSDPLPESIYYNSTFEATGWAQFQPVFDLELR
ncbi:MAG TPA: hypothetical protein VNV44_14095 [Solirubrobacteraceae bacterium]|jgi:hypothetical protein|nr:hypothetical protein [Solirubrobacteraceae bacterium]